MKFFPSVNKANAELEAAEAALQPDLEKAGIKTAMRDGKVIPIADASISEKYLALRTANPPGTDLQERSALLESNDVIARRCEKAESDLAIAQTSVASLTREKAALTEKLTAAEASINSMTAEKADLTNQLKAAVNQFSANAKELTEHNRELSRICLANGCLELVGEDGKPLAADATPEQKLKAAEAIPFADKLKANQGAVHAAMTRTGLSANSLPAGASGTTSLVEHNLLAKLETLTDPVERAQFMEKHRSELFTLANRK